VVAVAKIKTYKGVPVPQWYDQELDDWVFYTNEYMKELLSKIESLQEELEGIKSAQTDGSQKVQVSAEIEALLQGFATEGKLEQVRALLAGTATEDTLEQARILLASLDGKDYATQATLAAVLAKLGQLETEIQAVKANQLSGEQKVQQVGNIATLYSMNFADRPLYTEITEPTVFVLMNSAMDMWWTDGSADWVVI
jgi:hypothetical protein